MAEEQKTHTHVLEDGTVVEHSHGSMGIITVMRIQRQC